jgi:hypothetical protein
LRLDTFLAFDMASITQASRLTPPTIQTCRLLLVLTLVGRVRARRGLDLHGDDVVKIGKFPNIATRLASSWLWGSGKGEMIFARIFSSFGPCSTGAEGSREEGRSDHLEDVTRDVISVDPALWRPRRGQTDKDLH